MRAVVVGAGLAGCEAAWALAERGVSVTLCEMK
ncbi:MAG: FAD-dependent oxidoreductase, partial [Oscillospiraceae bacterium]